MKEARSEDDRLLLRLPGILGAHDQNALKNVVVLCRVAGSRRRRVAREWISGCGHSSLSILVSNIVGNVVEGKVQTRILADEQADASIAQERVAANCCDRRA